MAKTYKIAVIGGTGKAGSFVVKELIKQGYSFKLLTRNSEKIIDKYPMMEVITGNVRNYDTVLRLVSGCQAVISTLGPSKGEPETCSTAVWHLSRVMPKLNVKRYIEVAGLGIDTPDDKKGFKTRLIGKIIRWLFPAVVKDRQKVYDILKSGKLKWTIVRCPMIQLTNEQRDLKISLLDSPGNKISASDLAIFLVNQIHDDKYIGKCPFVAS
jgi:putative NADH-flavin reductase